mmetsp:Transcript_80637/g.168119  ORF Transcript_80637/g.168119 Transcript_80637/m.168119 type:complete len:888 (-) Transcript_80637:122-2785(-)
MPLATKAAVTMKKGMFFTNDGMLKPRTGFSAPRRARTLQNALSQNEDGGALANASRPATWHQASGKAAEGGRARSSSPPRKSEGAGPRPSVKAEYVPTWGRKSKVADGGEDPRRAAARPSSTPAMTRSASKPEFQPSFARGKSTLEGVAGAGAGGGASSSTPAAAVTRSASQAGLQSQTSRADYAPSWGRGGGTSKFDSAEEKEAARRAEILGAAHTARPTRGEYEPAWGRGRKTGVEDAAKVPSGTASEGSSKRGDGNRAAGAESGDGARSGSTPATARQSRVNGDRGVRRSSVGSGSGMNRSASTSALDRKDGFAYGDGSATSRGGLGDGRKSAFPATDVAANAANAVNSDAAGGPLGWGSLNESATTGRKKLIGWSASKMGAGATSANIGDTPGAAGPAFSYEGAGMPSWREEDGVIGRGRQRGGVAGGTLGGKMLDGNGRTLTGETVPNITEKNTEMVEQEKWQKWRQLVEKNTLGGHYDRMPVLLRTDYTVDDPDQKEHDAALADSRMLHNRRPSDVLHPKADHPKPPAATAFNDRACRLREGRGMRRALMKDDPPVTEWTHHGNCSCSICKPSDMKAAGVLSHESHYNKVPPCGKDYHSLLPGQLPGEPGISKTFKSEGIGKTLTHGGAADSADEEKYFMRFLGRKVRGGQSPDCGSGMMMHRSMSENDIRYIAAGQYPLKHPELLTHGSKGHQPWQVSLGSARVRHGMDYVLDPHPQDPPPPSQVVASRKARGIFNETHSDEAARLALLRNQEVLRFADPLNVFKRPVFTDSENARVAAGMTSADFQRTQDVRCGNLRCSPRRGLSNSSSAMGLLLHHDNVNKTFEQEKAWRLRTDPLFADLCMHTSKNSTTQKQLVESLKNTHGIHVVKAKDEMLWETN